MSAEQDRNPANWPEAIATVTSCTYTPRAGRAMAFGLPTNKRFRIAYQYWAGDAQHSAELFAAKAMPQGTLFAIRYDPALPHRSHGDSAQRAARLPLLTLGIAGSVLLSLLWLLVLRGCSSS